MWFPLRWKGEDIGALFIGDDVGRTFTPEVVPSLSAGVCRPGRYLIGNAELMAKDAGEAQTSGKALAGVQKKSRRIFGTTTLRERLHLIARHVTEILRRRSQLRPPETAVGKCGLKRAMAIVQTASRPGKPFPIRSGPGLGLTSHIAYLVGRPWRAPGDELTSHWASDLCSRQITSHQA